MGNHGFFLIVQLATKELAVLGNEVFTLFLSVFRILAAIPLQSSLLAI